jgi:uncharacterized protein
MRAIPPELDPTIVRSIDDRLDGVEREHDVRIGWAIESGSRAWGFPSPDSDYDCRFIYVRHPDDYAALWPARDVIETPLDEIYDVNGWDLAKAVRLLVKGNAVALEWLRSPIVYRGDEGFRDRLLALAEEVVRRDLIIRHYLHVGQRQLQGNNESLKRFFYALRPAAALRWLDDHPEARVPPMDLPTLLDEADVSDDIRDAARELIAAKVVTRELGAGSPPEVLTRFVDEQLARAERYEVEVDADPTDARARAEEWFRDELRRG